MGPFGQTSLHLYDDMLGIEPLELHFPLEHNKQTSCSVGLTNETSNPIAFNIRTPSKQYSTRPDKGIVLPGRKLDVKITLQPQECATQVTNTDKFVVQSTKVKEGLADEDIIDHMFNNQKVVDEINLMVVYEPEKYQVDLSLDRQPHVLLVGERWNAWLHLVRRLMDVQLSDQADTIRWKLTTNGIFSVKSMY